MLCKNAAIKTIKQNSVQKREKWRALVKEVRNLPVPHNVKNFLIS